MARPSGDASTTGDPSEPGGLAKPVNAESLTTVLGVSIDPVLLELALTHRSYAYEHGGLAHNERLEREMALRNLTMGGESVSVRAYDPNGNYLGSSTMPAWQADILKGQ